MDSHKLESSDVTAGLSDCGYSLFALPAKYLFRRVQVMRSTVKKHETTPNVCNCNPNLYFKHSGDKPPQDYYHFHYVTTL